MAFGMAVFVKLSSNKRYGKTLDESCRFGVGPLKGRRKGGRWTVCALGEASLQLRDDEWREFENGHRRNREDAKA